MHSVYDTDEGEPEVGSQNCYHPQGQIKNCQ